MKVKGGPRGGFLHPRGARGLCVREDALAGFRPAEEEEPLGGGDGPLPQELRVHLTRAP